VDRLERLTDLVLTLLQDGPPKTLQEIAEAVPGYPPPGEARRQAFERDKRTLREQGIVVRTVPVAGPEQVGYRITPEDFYLPDLELSSEEQVALNLAVAAVHGGDASGRLGLWRLGAADSVHPLPALAEVPLVPALAPLFAALSGAQGVRFRYGGQVRRVAPVQLRFYRGWWYLVGWDVERQAARTFRVDRIEGLPEPDAALGPPPSDLDPQTAWSGLPWRAGDEEAVVARVRVDPPLAASARQDVVGGGKVVEEPDGSVVLELPVTNRSALVAWLLEFGEHAELLDPPELRRELLDWLSAVRDAPVSEPPSGSRLGERGSPGPTPAGVVPAGAGAGGGSRRGTRSGGSGVPRDAGSRLVRLLAVLTVLARQGRTSLAALAERFGTTPAELHADLELAACCGLPPYTPDQLMEIIVDGDQVEAHLDAALARPRRLSAAEGLALLAAGRAVAAVPGLAEDDQALARAVEKLEAALGSRGVLSVDLDEPSQLGVVQAALGAEERLALRYFAAGRDEIVERVVDPASLLAEGGRWYLVAWTPEVQGYRRYRVDRILAAQRTGQRRVLPAEPPPPRGLEVPDPEAQVVVLAVDAEGRRLLEGVPHLAWEETSDGGVRVTLAVTGQAWLGRLLVRLGPRGRVLAPSELAGLGRATAARILSRYARSEKH